MPEMKTLCGYEVVDAKARQDIEALQEAVAAIPEMPDLSPYATETYVDNAVNSIKPEVYRFITPSEAGPDALIKDKDGKEFLDRIWAGDNDIAAYIDNRLAISITKTATLIYCQVSVHGQYTTGYTTYHFEKNDADQWCMTIKAEVSTTIPIRVDQLNDAAAYAKKADIPTKVSELANDSKYTKMEFLNLHDNIVKGTPLSSENAAVIERLKKGEHFPFCVSYGGIFYNVEKYSIDAYSAHDLFIYLPTQLNASKSGSNTTYSVMSFTIYLDKLDAEWYATIDYQTVDLTGGTE